MAFFAAEHPGYDASVAHVRHRFEVDPSDRAEVAFWLLDVHMELTRARTYRVLNDLPVPDEIIGAIEEVTMAREYLHPSLDDPSGAYRHITGVLDVMVAPYVDEQPDNPEASWTN